MIFQAKSTTKRGMRKMSNKKKPNHDQANSLREKVEKASAPLPTRSEIHAEKRNKTKWKIKFPIVRLIGIAFILIPITIIAITLNNKEDNALTSLFSLNGKVETFDRISIHKNQTGAKPNGSEEQVKEESKKEETKSETEPPETVNTSVQTGSEKTDAEEVVSPSETSDNENKEVEKKVIDKEKIEENVRYTEHVVENGETLYRISMKYYNSRSGEKIISDYNNLINNQVIVGQKLIIPIKNNE